MCPGVDFDQSNQSVPLDEKQLYMIRKSHNHRSQTNLRTQELKEKTNNR